MMLQMARTQDHFWALGVGRDAPTAEIDRAYEALARSFHADRYRLAPDEDRRMAQEIFDCLAEAHRVLQDAARRRAYVAKLGRQDDDLPEPPRDLSAAPLAVPVRARPPARRAAPRSRSTRWGSSTCAPVATTRPSRCCGKRRASSRTRPTTGRRWDGRSSGRRPPMRAPPGRRSPSCGAPPRSTNATGPRPNTCPRSTRRRGQPEAAITELERLLALDPEAVELADELRRLRAQ